MSTGELELRIDSPGEEAASNAAPAQAGAASVAWNDDGDDDDHDDFDHDDDDEGGDDDGDNDGDDDDEDGNGNALTATHAFLTLLNEEKLDETIPSSLSLLARNSILGAIGFKRMKHCDLESLPLPNVLIRSFVDKISLNDFVIPTKTKLFHEEFSYNYPHHGWVLTCQASTTFPNRDGNDKRRGSRRRGAAQGEHHNSVDDGKDNHRKPRHQEDSSQANDNQEEIHEDVRQFGNGKQKFQVAVYEDSLEDDSEAEDGGDEFEPCGSNSTAAAATAAVIAAATAAMAEAAAASEPTSCTFKEFLSKKLRSKPSKRDKMFLKIQHLCMSEDASQVEDKSEEDQNLPDNLAKEAFTRGEQNQMWSRISHPSVIECFATIKQPLMQTITYVLDSPFVSLQTFLQLRRQETQEKTICYEGQTKDHMTVELRWTKATGRFIHEIASGLDHLLRNNLLTSLIANGGLDPQNVAIDAHGAVKIINGLLFLPSGLPGNVYQEGKNLGVEKQGEEEENRVEEGERYVAPEIRQSLNSSNEAAATEVESSISYLFQNHLHVGECWLTSNGKLQCEQEGRKSKAMLWTLGALGDEILTGKKLDRDQWRRQTAKTNIVEMKSKDENGSGKLNKHAHKRHANDAPDHAILDLCRGQRFQGLPYAGTMSENFHEEKCNAFDDIEKLRNLISFLVVEEVERRISLDDLLKRCRVVVT